MRLSRLNFLMLLTLIYLFVPSSLPAQAELQPEQNQRLAQSVERLRRAELITGLGSWEYDLNSDQMLLSQGAMRILGWSHPVQTGDEVDALVMPEDREMRKQAFRELIENGTTYDIQFKIQRQIDGAVLVIRSLAEYDAGVNTVFGTLHDITEEVSKSEELEGARLKQTYTSAAFLVVQLIVIISLIHNIQERRRSQREMAQSLKRNESLVRILKHPTESVQELIDYALEESSRMTESNLGCFYYYNEQTNKLTLNTWTETVPHCMIAAEQIVYKLEDTGIWAETVKQRNPLIINNFDQASCGRLMAIPILDGNKVVAVVGLANKVADYEEADVWQITLLMSSVWSEVQRRKADLALKEQKKWLTATLLSVGDGVIVTDETGKVVLMNEVAQRLIGCQQFEVTNRQLEEIFTVMGGKNSGKRLHLTEAVRSGLFTESEDFILVNQAGREIPIACNAAPIQLNTNDFSGIVLVFRDITAEREYLAEIEFLSYHDHLTGLYNRHYFEKQLKVLDTKQNLPLSVIIADLDSLKLANDSFGYATGDQILQSVAKVLQKFHRPGDLVARWGGDEFVLLLPQTTLGEARSIADQITNELRKCSINSVPVSASLGCHTKTFAEQSMQKVFKNAEVNLSRMKLLQSPGNRTEVIHALMAALYEKNPREEQHCQRVSKLSQLLGSQLGLVPREIKELEITGLFHDIGKVSIIDWVLNKPGKLTEEEWKEMKRHPEVGYRILSNVQDMSEIATYVLSHHERWDGLGYPQGLQGDEIPLQARIIAIVDSYDAMISFRPYRASLTKEAALREILANAGTQFDPKLAKVFVDVMKKTDEAFV